MLVYCLNNPTNGCDPCGTCFHRLDFWNDCAKCGGRTFGDKVHAVADWCANAYNYVTNTDSTTAKNNLSRDGFTFYKGTPVFSADWLGTAAFSFGIIAIGSDNLQRADFNQTLNHEYGHAVHLQQVGISTYAVTTAIPSLVGAGLYHVSPYIQRNYDNLPWERTADYLGGVNRGYAPGADAIGSIFWCYTLIHSALTQIPR